MLFYKLFSYQNVVKIVLKDNWLATVIVYIKLQIYRIRLRYTYDVINQIYLEFGLTFNNVMFHLK